MLSALEFSSIFERFFFGGEGELGLETFPSESHQSNRKTQGKLFLLLSKDIGLAAPVSCGARSLLCLWAEEQWQPCLHSVSALSLDLVFFLLMPLQPRSVTALIPSPPHTCKSNFYVYTNVYTFVLHVCSDPLPAVFHVI